VKQFAVSSAGQQFVSESIRGAAEDESLRSSTIMEQHPALLGRLVIVATSINVQTYLGTLYIATVLSQ